MKWYLYVVKQNFANFNGRASREEYWLFFLFNMIFSVVAFIVDSILGTGMVIYLLYLIILTIPHLAVFVRRMHDIGKSGVWFFIGIIPIIGAIWLLILLFKESESKENQYGPVPKKIL